MFFGLFSSSAKKEETKVLNRIDTDLNDREDSPS